jgi:hypothetical protein
MITGAFPKVRLGVKIVAVVSLVLAVVSVAQAQTQEESFEARLRKATEAYAKKSHAEEEEQKRLVAAFAAKREAMQEQEEAELCQAELAFRQRMASRKLEEAARLRELETKLKGNEEQLAKAVADLKGRMLAREAESERAFLQKRETFSQELKAKVAGELAKAETERERQKQIALMAAMTYFTGGAALPALAASGVGSSAASATKAVGATKVAPAMARKTPTGTPGLPVDRLPRPVGPPSQVDDDSIYPSWGIDDLIPLERVASALSRFGGRIAGRMRWLGEGASAMRSAPPASTIVGSRSVQMGVPKGAPINAAEMIGGRQYTGHALDRMMGRGVTPSVVENTIKIGEKSVGKTARTLEFFDPKNKVGVVIDAATGRVITVK